MVRRRRTQGRVGGGLAGSAARAAGWVRIRPRLVQAGRSNPPPRPAPPRPAPRRHAPFFRGGAGPLPDGDAGVWDDELQGGGVPADRGGCAAAPFWGRAVWGLDRGGLAAAQSGGAPAECTDAACGQMLPARLGRLCSLASGHRLQRRGFTHCRHHAPVQSLPRAGLSTLWMGAGWNYYTYHVNHSDLGGDGCGGAGRVAVAGGGRLTPPFADSALRSLA
jgi:hypothetical protein